MKHPLLTFLNAVFSLLVLFTICQTTHLQGQETQQRKPELRKNDRLVILGSTLIERAQVFGYLETAIQTAYPQHNLTVRNLGWSGDTVWAESRGLFDAPTKGYQRMLEHLQRLKPTVVWVAYGSNESFKQNAPSEFATQLEKLIADIKATGARVALITPLKMQRGVLSEKSVSNRNRSLEISALAIRMVATSRKIPVLNLYETFPLDKLSTDFTENGMHLNEQGYRAFANVVQSQLAPRISPILQLNSDLKLGQSRGLTLKDATKTATGLTLKVQQERLHCLDDSGNLPTWNLMVALPAGTYELSLGEKSVKNLSHQELAAGVSIPCTVENEQLEKLRRLIIQKNRLYFHRWRPQNVTYLFLFRKHEQGNNAKEIPMFDPLVQELDEQIQKLAIPPVVTISLKRMAE